MFYKIIESKRNQWLSSSDCTITSLIDYIVKTGQMRDAQIDAIKTYLFLKIACQGKPLSTLFKEGAFNTLDLNALELSQSTREYLISHPSAAALFEYSCMKNDKDEQVSVKLEKAIKKDPDSIDCNKVWNDVFYGVSYTDYLFSLPMGAGKTYLMAAFIYLDLYFAMNEPHNPAFAHNFIIFAPSGLKSSVIPSLKTIQNFNPSWIIPEPAATDIKRIISFELLDQNKTKKKSNQIKNPNVQKISNHQPISELFGLIAVTNAEKVIYDRLEKEDMQISLFDKDEQAYIRGSKELRDIIGKIPNLSVFIDEVHHASAAGDSKLRIVAERWAEGASFNSIVGFSGTPYLERAEKIKITEQLSVGTDAITNVVYYYPLIDGVGNFLKRPIIKVETTLDSARIVENGVRLFFDTYKDTIYEGGLVAKLGIYCSGIAKLEEVVYPVVAKVVSEYGLDTNCILKFYRESTSKTEKKYKAPVDSQMQFDILDKPFSKIRVVLLVQIGKEGWDCKSLTGIILSQQGDCNQTMVLQTACRCLRQVVKGAPETALIYLNDSNADKLESQLKNQHHTSMREFSEANNEKTIIQRYNRTTYLKLPKVDFYQLKINYESLVIEEADILGGISKSTDNTAITADIIKTTDLSMQDLGITIDDSERGNEPASFNAWLYRITKGSFGFLTMEQLRPYKEALNAIFDQITYTKDGVRYYSSKYNHSAIEANIRKAFCDKCSFSTSEELIPEEANLLNIANFTSTVQTEKPEDYYPDAKTVENIMLDDNEKLKLDPKIQQLIDLAMSTGNEAFAKDVLKQHSSHPQKNRSFHYLPYRTDSGFEQTFLREVLGLDDIATLDLEVYYNGDRAMTEFKIKCYKNNNGKWSYVGIYTPDFLIIKRKDGKIHKAIIVETKGDIYKNDPTFKDKRTFMETEFSKKNNEAFGYQRFDYLYLEDSLPDSDRIILTHKKTKEFFEEK